MTAQLEARQPARAPTIPAPQEGFEYLMGGGEGGLLEGEGGMAMAMQQPAGCSSSDYTYKSIRLRYAHNGRAVTFVHDEEWCIKSTTGEYIPGTYDINWAREFRYDGARQRYLERGLFVPDFMNGIITPTAGQTVWSDYDGDEIYGSYKVSHVSPFAVVPVDAREPGIWHHKDGVSYYYHNDHLGTLRRRTDSSGEPPLLGTPPNEYPEPMTVFTAFGERIDSGAAERFGYAGAWGYQTASSDFAGDPYVTGFPFQHLGARYYDPASGRFLQRDPIGIADGTNVYAYCDSNPLVYIDPTGLTKGGKQNIKPSDLPKNWDKMPDKEQQKYLRDRIQNPKSPEDKRVHEGFYKDWKRNKIKEGFRAPPGARFFAWLPLPDQQTANRWGRNSAGVAAGALICVGIISTGGALVPILVPAL